MCAHAHQTHTSNGRMREKDWLSTDPSPVCLSQMDEEHRGIRLSGPLRDPCDLDIANLSPTLAKNTTLQRWLSEWWVFPQHPAAVSNFFSPSLIFFFIHSILEQILVAPSH